MLGVCLIVLSGVLHDRWSGPYRDDRAQLEQACVDRAAGESVTIRYTTVCYAAGSLLDPVHSTR